MEYECNCKTCNTKEISIESKIYDYIIGVNFYEGRGVVPNFMQEHLGHDVEITIKGVVT
jgi:hypothetical protein